MENQPMKLRLGQNDAIPGWEEGLKLMSEGEKGYLFVPSDLAYGGKGVKNPDDPTTYIIPPDEDLIFEIELAEVEKNN
jgi:FKBP-type peptidyl-prolyl cis-trans isomerase